MLYNMFTVCFTANFLTIVHIVAHVCMWCIQNPFEHLRWIFLQKRLSAKCSISDVWMGSEYASDNGNTYRSLKNCNFKTSRPPPEKCKNLSTCCIHIVYIFHDISNIYFHTILSMFPFLFYQSQSKACAVNQMIHPCFHKSSTNGLHVQACNGWKEK